MISEETLCGWVAGLRGCFDGGAQCSDRNRLTQEMLVIGIRS